MQSRSQHQSRLPPALPLPPPLFRALTSGDQSFPLTGAFAYSVYKFQSKRIKTNPEGPFLAGNPIVGAVLTTVINLGLACGVSRAGEAGLRGGERGGLWMRGDKEGWSAG